MLLPIVLLAGTRHNPTTWLTPWKANILAGSKTRYCDTETGEELGWLMSPFLEGFSYGYLATKDTDWIDRLVDWTDSWFKRGVTEPDGFTGWPKKGTGGLIEDQLNTDSLLGEAMAFRPVVRLAAAILNDPTLKAKYGAKARQYLAAAVRDFVKWDARGCWREVKNGGLWVVPAFGLDAAGTGWTEGYTDRVKNGFSNPVNKENLIASWMLELGDATHKRIYWDRAQSWFKVMKARMRPNGDNYLVWNYWDPAGPWDYKPDGSTRHWVGVHPNGGYYGIDVGAIVEAFEHGMVFSKSDIDKLIATNRDFMWNQKLEGATFGRIDGGAPDQRWLKTPGVLWAPLCSFDATLRKVFEATFEPTSWGGLGATPWYVWRMNRPPRD